MPASRPRVVVVAEGPPSLGGMATFAMTVIDDRVLREHFDLELVNTTRAAVRSGGTMSAANVWAAVVDAVRTFRAARHAEVVHLQTASEPLLPLLRTVALCRAARAGGAQVLVHVHSFAINSGRPDALRLGRLARFLFRRLGAARAVVAVSDPGRELLRALIPGTQVLSIDNAVDASIFEIARPAEGIPRIIFVGTLTKRKGVPDLVAALSLVREREVGEWELWLVGGGAQAGERETDEVTADVVARGFEASLVGPKRDGDLRAALGAASIFVLPSHFEGQPIAILEAMASGLPVVATRVGAVPDLVRDDIEGLLVEPGDREALADALARLLGDGEQRASLGAAARRRCVGRFSIDRFRERIAALYSDAAGASRRSRGAGAP